MDKMGTKTEMKSDDTLENVALPDKNNKTIYIFTTFFENDNYGGLLQAFALQKYLNCHGYTAIDVSYKTEYSEALSKTYSIQEKIRMNYNGTNFKDKVRISVNLIKRIALKNICGRKINRKIEIRKKLFRSFRENQIVHTNAVYTDNDLRELPNNAYAYITGSDLVWLLGDKCDLPAGYWLLPFSGKKISYAASIPMKTLSNIQKQKISEALADYKAISVREFAGKQLLEQCVPKHTDIYQVVDPVFLLTKDEWVDLLKLKDKCRGEYICTYFLGESSKNRKLSKYISKRVNRKIINVAHALRFCDNDLMFGTAKVDVSVPEFIDIIRCASMVITDSFHGAAFSEIFGIPYIVTERFEGMNKNNLNERLFTLLKNSGKERLYFNDSLRNMRRKFDEMESFNGLHSSIKDNITESKMFLRKALES